MRTLGMIGGTSWHSTIEYYRYINSMVGDVKGTRVNPPLLMYSLNVELMARGDWEEINTTYLNISQTLERAGAEALLICANTPHKVCPYVEPKINIPFLHIASAIGEEAQRLGLKKLGLLGTKPVMEDGFIGNHLTSSYSIETLTPEDAARDEMQRIIADELTHGKFLDSTKEFVLREMSLLKAKGADGMILGCTELPMLIQTDDAPYPMLDTTYLHARKAASFILGG